VQEKSQRPLDIRAAPLGNIGQRLADDPQQMPPPFFRRQIEFHLVSEKQQPHLVAIT
jgi:hypothetical protein